MTPILLYSRLRILAGTCLLVFQYYRQMSYSVSASLAHDLMLEGCMEAQLHKTQMTLKRGQRRTRFFFLQVNNCFFTVIAYLNINVDKSVKY